MENDSTNPIASMIRKLDPSIPINTQYTDGKVVISIGFKPTIEQVSYDEHANNRELDSHCRHTLAGLNPAYHVTVDVKNLK